MDLITRTPGLVHLAEQIFSNLDRNNLLQCQKVNEYWASILRNPWFWYKRMMKNTQEHQKEWMGFSKKLSKLSLTKDMTLGLNIIYKNLEHSMTLHRKDWSVLSALESPNTPNELGRTPIDRAASKGCTEIVKILVPLLDNPNAPDNTGWTPIHGAATYGHTDIVKILAQITDNPNAPDNDGDTPISRAAWNGHNEIVKILDPLTDNPNVPNKNGETPIIWAARYGHTENVKILVPLTDNPNAQNNDGETPIYWAAMMGYSEIVKILVLFDTQS